MDAVRPDIRPAETGAQRTPPAASGRELLARARARLRDTFGWPDWSRRNVFEGHWTWLLISTRVLGTVTAVVLLIFHHLTPHDDLFAIVAVIYAAVSLIAFTNFSWLQRVPAAWVIDTLIPFALIVLSREWRSPFYILALTTLILPATALAYRRALAWGLTFSVCYFGIAFSTRLQWQELRYTARLETFATHLLVPLLVALALAYAADVLARLREEQERTEKMAIEAERRRIAWELHDSAKQRVHAAHLVLSSLEGRIDPEIAAIVTLASDELSSAVADMQTSLAELRAPLEGRLLDEALRQRAQELAPATDARIEVHGKAPRLGPFAAAHAYRIAAEALVNAVRHARATRIDVRLSVADEELVVVVSDDGQGMPDSPRPGSTGLRSIRGRAATIGAQVSIDRGPQGRGTAVRLELPLAPSQGGPQ